MGSVENHRHCQATILAATGSPHREGITWSSIENRSSMLANLPNNWISHFKTNNNITDDLAGILDIMDGAVGETKASIDSLQSSVTASLSTLNTNIANINGSVTTINGSITGLAGVVANISNIVSSLQSSVSTLTTQATNFNTTLTSLSGRVTSLEDMDERITANATSISQLGSSYSSLLNSIGYVSGQVAEFGSSLANLSNRVTVLEGQNLNDRISTNTASISTLFSRVSGVTSSINSLNNSLTSVNSSISLLSARIDNVESAVSNVTSTTQTLAGNVTSLINSVGTLTSEFSSINVQMRQFESSISEINGNVETLQANVSQFTTQVTSQVNALETQVSAIAEQFGGIQSTVASLSSSIASINGSISAINSNIASISTSVGDHETRLATIEGQMGLLNNSDVECYIAPSAAYFENNPKFTKVTKDGETYYVVNENYTDKARLKQLLSYSYGNENRIYAGTDGGNEKLAQYDKWTSEERKKHPFFSLGRATTWLKRFRSNGTITYRIIPQYGEYDYGSYVQSIGHIDANTGSKIEITPKLTQEQLTNLPCFTTPGNVTSVNDQYFYSDDFSEDDLVTVKFMWTDRRDNYYTTWNAMISVVSCDVAFKGVGFVLKRERGSLGADKGNSRYYDNLYNTSTYGIMEANDNSVMTFSHCVFINATITDNAHKNINIKFTDNENVQTANSTSPNYTLDNLSQWVLPCVFMDKDYLQEIANGVSLKFDDIKWTGSDSLFQGKTYAQLGFFWLQDGDGLARGNWVYNGTNYLLVAQDPTDENVFWSQPFRQALRNSGSAIPYKFNEIGYQGSYRYKFTKEDGKTTFKMELEHKIARGLLQLSAGSNSSFSLWQGPYLVVRWFRCLGYPIFSIGGDNSLAARFLNDHIGKLEIINEDLKIVDFKFADNIIGLSDKSTTTEIQSSIPNNATNKTYESQFQIRIIEKILKSEIDYIPDWLINAADILSRKNNTFDPQTGIINNFATRLRNVNGNGIVKYGYYYKPNSAGAATMQFNTVPYNQHKVSFEGLPGKFIKEKYNEQMTTDLSVIPSKTGYVFKGYYYKVNDSSVQYYDQNGDRIKSNGNPMVWNINNDVTLYARWCKP